MTEREAFYASYRGARLIMRGAPVDEVIAAIGSPQIRSSAMGSLIRRKSEVLPIADRVRDQQLAHPTTTRRSALQMLIILHKHCARRERARLP